MFIALPTELAATHVGGKAFNLSRLMRAGLHVPDAVVIPASVFLAQLQRPDLAAAVKVSHGAKVRELLSSAPISFELPRALVTKPLAVRSSAVGEDGSALSFAGQYDTMLDVRGAENVLNAIRRCWASAFSERAIAYRIEHGGTFGDVSMAVIIQELVPAERAGLLFTCDPITGADDVLCIEGVAGLGKALVCGHVRPDRCVLEKSTGKVRSRDALIDDALVTELRRVSAHIEAEFGPRQDIEWAYAGGELFVLQARAVTTPNTDRTVWTSANAAELLPDAATPMTFSVVKLYVDALLDGVAAVFQMRIPDVLGLVAGRIYFNAGTFVSVLRRFPGMRGEALGRLFGGDEEELAKAISQLRDEDLPEAKVNLFGTLLSLPRLLWWMIRDGSKRAHEEHLKIQATTRALRAEKLGELSDEALVGRVRASVGFTFGHPSTMASMMVGLASANALEVLAARWLGSRAFAAKMLSAIGGLDSAEAGLALWRLSRSAREPDFEGRLEEFFALHGHHARGEVDVAVPRWREEREYVLSLIESYAQASANTAAASSETRRGEREAIVKATLGSLSFPKRLLFRWLLHRAEQGLRMRENFKSEAIRRVDYARSVLLEAGRRLVERGVISNVNDVFFLSLEELLPALRERKERQHAIARRRADYERNQSLRPPTVVVGRYQPARHLPPPDPAKSELLRGIPVSAGIVEGRARVILRADSKSRLEPGEILIAPFTDPGWTPYFIPAAAIVMEFGGVMSHGSIVAREYGIPAVVNIAAATRLIRDGQLLRVNGDTGEVWLVDRENADALTSSTGS